MRESKPSDQEVFESIPWEELRDLGDTSRRRRVWLLVGGAVLLAVVVFSVARAFSAPDPLLPAEVTAAGNPDPVTAPPTPPSSQQTPPELQSPQVPELAREADLMAAVDVPAEQPSPAEWQAASYAEWFVLEFFTLDGSDSPTGRWGWLGGASSADEAPEALSHVEWVRTLRMASLGDGRWTAQVAFRRLVSTDGVAHTRLPTQAVEVVVNMNPEGPEVVDLPRFVPLPEAAPGQWWLGEPRESPPEAVIRTAWEEMSKGGADATYGEPRISRAGEVWRVEWAVIDEAGISWPVSLWVGPDGTPVPAGG